MKSFYKNLLTILSQRERYQFSLLIVYDILISILDIAFLAFLVFVIHFYTQPQASQTFYLLPSWLSNTSSLLLVTIFLVLYAVKNVFGFMIHRNQSRFIARVATRLSSQKLNEFLSGSYDKYVNVDSAVHIRRISHQPIDFAQHILGGIQQIVTQVVLIAFTISIMLFFNAKVFLFLFLMLLPPVIAVFYLIKRKLKSIKEHSQVSIEKSWQHLREALDGFVESNIYNKKKFFVDRYLKHQKDFNAYVSDLLILQGIPSRMIELFALLGLFLLIAINRMTPATDGATIITIGAFIAAAYKIIPGIVKILNTAGQIHHYAYTIAGLQPGRSVRTETNEEEGVNIFEEVSLNNINFSYNGVSLLRDVSLKMQPGDFVGISGCSGKGKTTILNLLLGFLEPKSGTVEINNQSLSRDNGHQHWKHVAYVKQEPFLIHDTIARNIILDNAYLPERLQEVIDITGLNRLLVSADSDELVMENGKNLSGGQRQRIAIARALYKNADLIILDEPFNELDEPTEQSLLSHLKYLASKGKMIILITHNRSSFCYCNKMLSLDNQTN